MSFKATSQKLDSATFERHLQVKIFEMPEVYSEKPDFETEDRLMLCKLFINSFKALSYIEFQTFQALLILQDSWDKRAEPPTEITGGMFTTHDPVYLSLNVVRRCLGTDCEKFVAIIRSCIRKLPILETMIDEFLLREIKAAKIDIEYKAIDVSRSWMEYIGYLIKNRTRRENGVLTDKWLESALDKVKSECQ